MDPDQMREPENARISEYDSGTRSYSVVPAVQGTELVEEQVEKAVAAAIVKSLRSGGPGCRGLLYKTGGG